MRPPESFSTAAAKFLAYWSGAAWMVGVVIFITKVCCCACAAPSVSAPDKAHRLAAAAARRIGRALKSISSSSHRTPLGGGQIVVACGLPRATALGTPRGDPIFDA